MLGSLNVTLAKPQAVIAPSILTTDNRQPTTDN
jgi:hypothetical protein